MALALSGCGGGMSRQDARQRAAALSALGRKMFFDVSLSGNGRMSCSSCHDPAFAYGPPPGLVPGKRAVPSLRYLQTIPQFTEHYFEGEETGDDSVDNGPTGGLTWDGRVDRGRDQARIPLLSADEMGNASPEALVARMRKTGYRAVTFDDVLEALETFEQDPHEFYPYSSKFDRGTLTAQESRGLSLFRDPAKGNCSVCHTSERATNGSLPQFTDYGFAALGLPRNASPGYLDLGLCGPVRKDLRAHKEYCGMFITPTLRNVATRHTFFHNGVFSSLTDAVGFYAKRDQYTPEYPDNIDGSKTSLTEGEIDDIVAFLQTLTDGYPKGPG